MSGIFTYFNQGVATRLYGDIPEKFGCRRKLTEVLLDFYISFVIPIKLLLDTCQQVNTLVSDCDIFQADNFNAHNNPKGMVASGGVKRGHIPIL